VKRAVLIVDHGSRLAEANELLLAVAERVRERLPDRLVRTAHLDLAEPGVADAIDACVGEGAGEIVVAPWFLSPGAHTAADLPRLAAEAARRHPGVRIACAPPLGLDERLVEVLLERIRATPASAG
jgi:sirohydrochlorin ferrochelatase